MIRRENQKIVPIKIKYCIVLVRDSPNYCEKCRISSTKNIVVDNCVRKKGNFNLNVSTSFSNEYIRAKIFSVT